MAGIYLFFEDSKAQGEIKRTSRWIKLCPSRLLNGEGLPALKISVESMEYTQTQSYIN